MSTRLETACLVIRTFESRDAEAWVAMVNDPELAFTVITAARRCLIP